MKGYIVSRLQIKSLKTEALSERCLPLRPGVLEMSLSRKVTRFKSVVVLSDDSTFEAIGSTCMEAATAAMNEVLTYMQESNSMQTAGIVGLAE